MANVDQPDEQQLLLALQGLETDLGKPVVPGELSNWLLGVRASLDSIHRLFRERVAKNHKSDFKTIAEMDPDQLTRVQSLREEDERLQVGIAHLVGLAARTHKRKATPVSDTALERRRTALVDSGLQWITNVRKHEGAIRTWFMEAFIVTAAWVTRNCHWEVTVMSPEQTHRDRGAARPHDPDDLDIKELMPDEAEATEDVNDSTDIAEDDEDGHETNCSQMAVA